MRLGIISDTHGLLRPQVFEVFREVDLILHAGDVGEGVLVELSTIAPILAVRGNTDPLDAPELPQFQDVTRDGPAFASLTVTNWACPRRKSCWPDMMRTSSCTGIRTGSRPSRWEAGGR